jgi:hypothetical protein
VDQETVISRVTVNVPQVLLDKNVKKKLLAVIATQIAMTMAPAHQGSVIATILSTDKVVNSKERPVSSTLSLAISKVNATSQMENVNAMMAFMARSVNSLQMMSKISKIPSKKKFLISFN